MIEGTWGRGGPICGGLFLALSDFLRFFGCGFRVSLSFMKTMVPGVSRKSITSEGLRAQENQQLPVISPSGEGTL